MNRLLASTATALLMSALVASSVYAGPGGTIAKTLKSVTDDVLQGAIKGGRQLDGVVDDAIDGAAGAATRALPPPPDGFYDDIVDAVPQGANKAAPPLGGFYDDIDAAGNVIRNGGGNGATPSPGGGNGAPPSLGGAYDDIDAAGNIIRNGGGNGAPPSLGGAYDDIDAAGNIISGGGNKAPASLGGAYDDIDAAGNIIRSGGGGAADIPDGVPRYVNQAAGGGGQYDDITDQIRRNADIDPNAHYGGQELLDQLNKEALDNVGHYDDPSKAIARNANQGPSNYLGPDDLVRLNDEMANAAGNVDNALGGAAKKGSNYVGWDEMVRLQNEAAAGSKHYDDLILAPRQKPKKPPITKLGNAVKKTVTTAARQIPVAPVLRAAAPVVAVNAAKKGMSKITKVVIGGTIGVIVTSIAAGTTFVLYETVEPVQEGIDTALQETGDGLNVFHDKVNEGLETFGEFLHPGDPATVTFYNNADMLVEIYKVDSSGNETALAVLSMAGERETLDVKIGDRLSVYKGGVPANEFYDVTTEINGSDIYVQ